MKIIFRLTLSIILSLALSSCKSQKNVVNPHPKITQIFLAGDSTMADYTNDEDKKDYMRQRYPQAGWGQVFQEFFTPENLKLVKQSTNIDSILVIDKAKAGRSTRTFFQEGRWRYIVENLQPKDYVLIQFGHNDEAEDKTERYVPEQGYKEFLRLFILQVRQKNATPILLTPVARNYPWKDGVLQNIHKYDQAVKDIAQEQKVTLIDLNQLSRDYFTTKGQEYVTNNYFMNLPEGKYEAYPNGSKDNTHFQPEGAKAVANLVFEKLITELLKNNKIRK